MAFDFKKEYKEFYMPKNKPSILTVLTNLHYHLHMKFDDGGRLTVAFLFALTVIIMYNKFDLRLYRLLRETPLQTSAEVHAQALSGGGK